MKNYHVTRVQDAIFKLLHPGFGLKPKCSNRTIQNSKYTETEKIKVAYIWHFTLKNDLSS